MINKLTHQHLPKEIIVGYGAVSGSNLQGQKNVIENVSGGTLVKKLANHYLGLENLKIVTKKYEKPRALSGDHEISVSFSHTDSAITAALSERYLVGCDMEAVSRTVNERLGQRMKHENESQSLYDNHSLIRIWTLKEAALKMIGTGLRKPMHCVCITENSEALFFVNIDNGKRAKICSFQHQDFWISICYQ